MKFVQDEPALLIESTLVVADLHIGIEYALYKKGIRIPSQTKEMKERIKEILRKTKAKKLVLMGDIKHSVPGISWQELREIPEMVEELSSLAKVEIIPGNHDGGIEKIVSTKVYPMEGFVRDNVAFNHGHSWPTKDMMKAEIIVVSHNHPTIELKDRLGHKMIKKCWIIARLNKEKLRERYKVLGKLKTVIIPAFNPLIEGVPFNRESRRLGPLLQKDIVKKMEAYLLDGTYLGDISSL